MRPHYWALLIFFFAARGGIAQGFKPGYIKLKDRAQQPGLIGRQIPGRVESIEYKSSDSSDVTVYRAEEIDGYRITDGLNFTSYQYANRWVFVEFFVSGELTLIRKNYIFLLRRRDSNQFDSLDHEPVQRLRKIMRDCPNVAVQSPKIRLDTTGLSAYVRTYNECVANKNTKLDGILRTVSVALLVGYDQSNASFTDQINSSTRFLTGGKIGDRAFMQVGVDVTLKSYKVSHYFGLYAGALYSPDRYNEVNRIVYNRNNSQEVNQYSIEYTELKLPVGLELMAPAINKLKFHVRAGYVFRKTISWASEHPANEVQRSPGIIYSEPPGQLLSFKPRPSPMVAAGMDYRVFGKSRIRLQVSASVGKIDAVVRQDPQETNIDGRFTSFNIMAGYIF